MSQTKLQQLIQEAKKVLDHDEIDADTSLLDLGVDSMNIVELIMLCEQIYGNNFDPDALELDEYTTFTELDERLNEMVSA